MRTLLLLLASATALLAQNPPGGIPNVKTLPAKCLPTGQPNIVFLTTGTVGPYYCSAPNTWTFVGGGSGGSTVVSCTITAGTSCTISGALAGAPVWFVDNSGNWQVPEQISGGNTTTPSCIFNAAAPITGTCSTISPVAAAGVGTIGGSVAATTGIAVCGNGTVNQIASSGCNVAALNSNTFTGTQTFNATLAGTAFAANVPALLAAFTPTNLATALGSTPAYLGVANLFTMTQTAPQFTTNGASSGSYTASGSTSGSAAIGCAAICGTPSEILFPITDPGGANYLFQSGAPGGGTMQSSWTNAPTVLLTNMTGTLTSPTFVAPALGTPASGVLTNTTGYTHSAAQYCGTTSACGHTAQATAQIVYGSAPLVTGTPSTVTISGISPAFTSTSSYNCTVTAQSGAATALISVANASASSFTITGPTGVTTVINYVCVGS